MLKDLKFTPKGRRPLSASKSYSLLNTLGDPTSVDLKTATTTISPSINKNLPNEYNTYNNG